MPTLRLRWRLLYAETKGWLGRGVIRSNAEIDADRLTNLCNCRAPQALPFLLNHPAAGRSLLRRMALHRSSFKINLQKNDRDHGHRWLWWRHLYSTHCALLLTNHRPKTATRFRPNCFALYRALSAPANKSVAAWHSAFQLPATPKLTVTTALAVEAA